MAEVHEESRRVKSPQIGYYAHGSSPKGAVNEVEESKNALFGNVLKDFDGGDETEL